MSLGKRKPRGAEFGGSHTPSLYRAKSHKARYNAAMTAPVGKSILTEEHFPLVLVYLAGVVDEENVRAMTSRLELLIDRAQADSTLLFVVIDTRHVSRLTAAFRKAFVAWESSVSDERFAYIGVRIMVITNPLVRGAITAVSWFSPRAKGIVTAKNVDRAVAELVERRAMGEHALDPDEAKVRAWFARSIADSSGLPTNLA